MAAGGCSKETATVNEAEYAPERLAELFPLEVGKYRVYRTDSTVYYPNYNRNVEVHAFQEKQVVDAQITDNLGRKAYRIFRFLRDTSGTGPWVSAGTFMVVPTNNTVEVIEDNLRVIKLMTPVRLTASWKGNRYLTSKPYQSTYSFSNDIGMGDWDFRYSADGGVFAVKNGTTLNNVLTVSHIDESVNVPIAVLSAYAAQNFSEEKYARGVGLVEQNYTMWEYQPNPGGQSPYRIGFGIRRTLIDYN